MQTLLDPSPQLQRAIDSFSAEAARGYLAAASVGLPTFETLAALREDLEFWGSARRDPMDYEEHVEATRGHYAQLVGVPVEQVAIGSQTSAITSVIAAAVPSGAEVLCVEGDFTSMVFPFLQRSDVTVRSVPLADIATSITDATWLVAFSLVQSATGEVADVAAITAAATAHGSYTFCDTTQATGMHPVAAAEFDATVCHSYKWLCSPRGVAFLTVNDRFGELLTPIQAGWYAGENVWGSIYGPAMQLAATARRFDVSPAWPAWVGARPAIRMFSKLDMTEVWARGSGLGNLLCDALEMPRQNQAIITWADPGGVALQRLLDAGLAVSGRAGRLRVAFHLWNTIDDVEQVARELGR